MGLPIMKGQNYFLTTTKQPMMGIWQASRSAML